MNKEAKFAQQRSERFLRLTEVRKRILFSPSQIYLLISRGKFPPAVHIGTRAVAWLESDIDAWIESHIGNRAEEMK